MKCEVGIKSKNSLLRACHNLVMAFDSQVSGPAQLQGWFNSSRGKWRQWCCNHRGCRHQRGWVPFPFTSKRKPLRWVGTGLEFLKLKAVECEHFSFSRLYLYFSPQFKREVVEKNGLSSQTLVSSAVVHRACGLFSCSFSSFNKRLCLKANVHKSHFFLARLAALLEAKLTAFIYLTNLQF